MISCSNDDNDIILPETHEINNSAGIMRNYSVAIDAGLAAWSKRRSCVRGSGNCAYAIVEENNFGEDTFPVTLKLADDGKIALDYKVSNEGEDEDNMLTFNTDISIPATICSELGVSSIRILSGSYPINYNNNVNGTVLLTAEIN